MPLRETSVMEERLRFVAGLLEGEGMSDVCRDFGISRKTGYKIFNRYKDEGLEALTDRSRLPVRYANQLPDPVEAMIVRLKCAQDPGASGEKACRRCADPGQEHGACGARSPRSCEPGPQDKSTNSRLLGVRSAGSRLSGLHQTAYAAGRGATVWPWGDGSRAVLSTPDS